MLRNRKRKPAEEKHTHTHSSVWGRIWATIFNFNLVRNQRKFFGKDIIYLFIYISAHFMISWTYYDINCRMTFGYR